ncbi:MAG: hypothetical protein LWW77_10000 [Propionibacteriales bacterium]|nr:hypothetical protein [Propionibacteriales bacterium]
MGVLETPDRLRRESAPSAAAQPQAADVRTVPISALDSPWLRAQSRVAIGRLNLPPLADLRAAFVELAAQGERTRLGYTLSASARNWLFDPRRLTELADEVVVEQELPSFAGPDRDEVGYRELEHLLRTIEVDNTTTAHFVRAGDHLVFTQNHALGDAHLSFQLTSALVTLARGEAMPAWVSAPQAAHPLWQAVTHGIRPGRNPLGGLLRDRISRINHQTSGRRLSPDWSPHPQTAFRSLSRESWQEVKAWRREHAPQASLASLQLVILRQALASAGIAITPETVVLYDCRRYLPGREQVRGNFVIARSQQLGDSPEDVSATLANTLEQAQPLATLVAATAKNALRRPRTRHTPPGQVDAECLPAFVFPPRSAELETLPWQQPDLRWLAVSSGPPRANAVTATMMLLGGRLSTSICYHPDVIDATSVHAAISLMESHPVALLERAVGM